MGINAYVEYYLAKDYHTEAGNTPITEEVDGADGLRLALVGFDYLNAATAHSLQIMHCGSVAGSRNSNAGAAAAAGQKDVICTTAPTDPAGNAAANLDIVAYQVTGGSWEWNIVASVAGSTITMTTNLAVICPANAPLRIFGVAADGFNFSFGLTASVVTHFDDTILCQAPFVGDPLYVYDGNGTNAGFINNLLFAYINK